MLTCIVYMQPRDGEKIDIVGYISARHLITFGTCNDFENCSCVSSPSPQWVEYTSFPFDTSLGHVI